MNAKIEQIKSKAPPPILNADEVFDKKSGRAFPDALDGTPQNYTSKTAADEQAEAAIEKPNTEKLRKGDVSTIIQTCSEAIEQIIDFEQERKETNSEISAIREKLETLGIGKKPLAMTIAYSKLTTDQREGFDLAYSILRQAIGEGIKQVDMFYDAVDGKAENATESA